MSKYSKREAADLADRQFHYFHLLNHINNAEAVFARKMARDRIHIEFSPLGW